MSCQETLVLFDGECHCPLSKKLYTEGSHLSFSAAFTLFPEGPVVVSDQAHLDPCKISWALQVNSMSAGRVGGSCQHQAESSGEALPP